MTPSPAVPPRPRNRLLAGLPPAEYAALAPHLEPVLLETRQLAYDVDAPITHVYFPEGAVVSVLGVMADGTAVETATIGIEGFVGLPVFLGTDRTSAQAFAQVPGPALRVPADAFRAVVAAAPALTLALHRYTQALFTFVAQSSVCNRRHDAAQRCARWLLLTADRAGRDEFPLTHQFLSQMLGVRRATVTEAMGALQAAGAVAYDMGRMQVRDRARLTAAACECYAVVAREFDRLVGPPPSGVAAPPDPLAHTITREGDRSALGDGAPPE